MLDAVDVDDLLYKALLKLHDENTYMRQRLAVRREACAIRKKTKVNKCEICGSIDNEIELHHIKPVARGGTNKKDNLLWLCHSCHIKANKEAFK
jgi:predicted restriction endonuclease